MIFFSLCVRMSCERTSAKVNEVLLVLPVECVYTVIENTDMDASMSGYTAHKHYGNRDFADTKCRGHIPRKGIIRFD